MPHWTEDYFERGYAQRWGLHPPSDQVRQEVSGLWALLRMTGGCRAIDIGCGHGRHALALTTLGAEVIGVDTAIALLNRARSLAAHTHTQIRLVRGDMRHLPIQSSCASAAIIMDAFGFFDSDKEHDGVLREAARVLTANGRLVMKIVNGGAVIDDFRPTDQQERDGIVVTIDRSLTLEPARMTERLRVTGSRGNGEYERRQRLYRVEELGAALERSGFDVVDVFATPDGTPFEPDLSATMWFVCQVSARVDKQNSSA
jgi:SAM-dependent methyltransferase